MSAKRFILKFDANQKKVRDGERKERAVNYGSRSKFRVAVVRRDRRDSTIYQVAIDPVTVESNGKDVMASREIYAINSQVVSDYGLGNLIGTTPARDKVYFRFISRDMVRKIRANSYRGFTGVRREFSKARVSVKV